MRDFNHKLLRIVTKLLLFQHISWPLYHSPEDFVPTPFLFYLSKYGDLAATIAAVLLDKEARSVALDANPFKGSLREPLIKVMALMRGLELQLAEGQPIVKLHDLDVKIGMMAHCFRTVFGYFLPEYKSNGRPGEASLVSPETMLVDMPKTGELSFDKCSWVTPNSKESKI